MMKILSSLLLLLCSFTFSFAQWTNASAGKTGRIYLCTALDANTCIGIGDWGKVYRTLDGGMTFDSVQTVFDTDIFSDIDFVNDSVGFICGGSWFGMHTSFLLRTTDRGQTWDSLNSDIFQAQMIERVDFLDAQTGFVIVGGEGLHKTTDGGQTFSVSPLPQSAFPESVGAMAFPDMQTGYASSTYLTAPNNYRYRIDKTTDQGQSWNTVWADSLNGGTFGTDRRISSLYFISDMEGYAGGANGTLLYTSDGGQNWSSSTLATDTTNLIQVQFTNPLNGYIAGIYAYGGAPEPFFSTTNGGQSWARQNFSFYDISMIGAAGYAVGNNFNLFVTQTGGLHTTAPQPEMQVELYPNPVAIGSGNNTITLRTPPEMAGSTGTITDLNGRVLRNLSLTGPEQTIDIRGLASGSYFLTLEHSCMRRISKKFVVIGNGIN
jgi:photosystem II stability/assembly factor-like uncharacterized protein